MFTCFKNGNLMPIYVKMNKIKISITPLEKSILKEHLKSLIQKTSPRIDSPQDYNGHDADLAYAWEHGLKESLDNDTNILLKVFESRCYEHELSELEVLAAMRACSAIRLAIKDIYLWDVDLDKLEMGKVNFTKLNEMVQRFYMCYAMLASFQEMLLGKMDPQLVRNVK